ncbi:MAG: HAD family hydrolase [Bacilli bacterium]|nr:HAD family hydrolase [Bacilli bacterium]
MNIKWLFFDVGTTLVNEEKAYDHRALDMIKDVNISFEEFNKKRIELAELGLDGNSAAIKFFNLNKTPWHSEDEILYEDTVIVLEYLKSKGYKLGVIANQKKGLKERLDEFGILKYFELIIASDEVGISKPDKEIFNVTISKVNCIPQECVMIGDRLDNDIIPANQIGMKTIWIRQGLAKYQAIKLGVEYSNFVVSSLSEIKDIL